MNPTVENQFLTTENIISSTGEINVSASDKMKENAEEKM